VCINIACLFDWSVCLLVNRIPTLVCGRDEHGFGFKSGGFSTLWWIWIGFAFYKYQWCNRARNLPGRDQDFIKNSSRLEIQYRDSRLRNSWILPKFLKNMSSSLLVEFFPNFWDFLSCKYNREETRRITEVFLSLIFAIFNVSWQQACDRDL